jgi:hypothetical protein
VSDSGGTRLTIDDDNQLSPRTPAANPLAPYGYEDPQAGYYPPLPEGVRHRWFWESHPERPYASGLPKLAERGQRPTWSDMADAAARYGTHVAQGLWDAGPGAIKRVMTGEVQPGTPEFNQLGADVAMNVGMLAAPIPRPYGSLGQFGAYHGTGAFFTRFSNDFIGTGEGHQVYGQGMYVGGHEGTGQAYQQSVGGRGMVPADERGMPVTGVALARKFYEPGQIVPGYAGEYDRVLRFNEHPDGYNWSVDVERVAPIRPPMTGHPQIGGLADHLKEPDNPEKWRVIAGQRSHSTMPDERDLSRIAAIRGWEMRPKGHLMDVWVVPEHHDFLDWDLKLSQQEPGVLAKLQDAGLAPLTPSFLEMSTGQELYKMIASQHMNAVRREGYVGREAQVQAERRASKELDDIGVVGNRYADQFSRNVKLTYTGTEPMNPVVRNFMDENHKTPMDLERRIRAMMDEDEMRRVNERLLTTSRRQIEPNYQLTDADRTWARESAAQTMDYYREGLEWLRNNKQHFKEGKKTYNYVVFNADNIEVRAIDKIPVSRFEGDPFGKKK